MDVHVGTHVDAPLHFIADGPNLEDVGLDPFLGSCWVADVGDAKRIGAEQLTELGVPSSCTRLLLRTNPEVAWFRHPFDEDFAAVTSDGAAWIVDRGMTLIGIDYVSIQRFEDGPEVHQILLGNDVCILEGLDLRSAPPGPYDLTCLPIRLESAEAAPARAILRSID
jgi:arylformamidase